MRVRRGGKYGGAGSTLEIRDDLLGEGVHEREGEIVAALPAEQDLVDAEGLQFRDALACVSMSSDDAESIYYLVVNIGSRRRHGVLPVEGMGKVRMRNPIGEAFGG